MFDTAFGRNIFGRLANIELSGNSGLESAMLHAQVARMLGFLLILWIKDAEVFHRVKYYKIIADNLSKAGFSWGLRLSD